MGAALFMCDVALIPFVPVLALILLPVGIVVLFAALPVAFWSSNKVGLRAMQKERDQLKAKLHYIEKPNDYHQFARIWDMRDGEAVCVQIGKASDAQGRKTDAQYECFDEYELTDGRYSKANHR